MPCEKDAREGMENWLGRLCRQSLNFALTLLVSPPNKYLGMGAESGWRSVIDMSAAFFGISTLELCSCCTSRSRRYLMLRERGSSISWLLVRSTWCSNASVLARNDCHAAQR